MEAPGDLPHDTASWNRLAQKHSMVNASIHTHRQPKSASKVDVQQHILLRALWPVHRECGDFKTDCENSQWITRQALGDAKKHLQGLESWRSYEKSFSWIDPEGTFALVRYYQRLSSTPRDGLYFSSQSKVQFSPTPGPRQAAAR
ncbi:hypothetical protein FALBO_16121 [Fusarium albosuccineum]|uniref:Uncharacterized protein n=1 Tax=Fusarium albosuccineum TaxID=1237068 RepID=A0A8H4KLX0_9HYPO|nr:hypothetical protein FALBO_16121 [Fusarium albosuccineum]